MGKGLSKKKIKDNLKDLKEYTHLEIIKVNEGARVITKFTDKKKDSDDTYDDVPPKPFMDVIIPKLNFCGKLNVLNLTGCEIDNEMFSNIFTKYMEKNKPPLTTLTMKSNSFDNITPFCDWFTNNTSLTHLDLSNNEIVHISCIGNALKTNKTLQILNLSHNQIKDVSNIGIALQKNEALTTLNLSINQIGDVSRIGNALKTNKTLTTLNLFNNGIVNVSSIGNALEKNKTLTTLNLSGNEIQDVSRIGEALETNETLTTLLLANNKINCCTNRGKDDNGDDIIVPNSTSIQKALKSNNTLTELDLNLNGPLVDGNLDGITSKEFKISIEKAINRNKEIVKRNKQNDNNKFMFHYELKF